MIIKINSLVIESFLSGLHMGKMAILLRAFRFYCVSRNASVSVARKGQLVACRELIITFFLSNIRSFHWANIAAGGQFSPKISSTK